MKTYNTIEDILNDHELMANDLKELAFSLDNISDELYKSISIIDWQTKIPLHTVKALWLKSEYERRQKEKKCTLNDIVKEYNVNEKKLTEETRFTYKPKNLIPFDLEKAKAGAKVFYRESEAKIVYEEENWILLVVFNEEENYSLWKKKGEYSGLFIESEPLPEMVSVEIPKDLEFNSFLSFYVKSHFKKNDVLVTVLQAFLK